MDLSVSIVSWNTRDLLDQCLKSIYESTRNIDCEVIVVDNASIDGSAEMVRQKYPQVVLIDNKDNAGFARANNQAYRISSGRYFMLLNPDVIVHSGLQGSVRFLDAHPTAAVVGCKSLNSDGSIQVSWNRYYPSLMNELLYEKFTRHISPLRAAALADKVFKTAWVGGACLAARRSAIDEVGLLDELYYIYTEETDWCRRFADAGWLVMHAPRVVITHFGGQSTSQVKPQMRVELAKSKARFIKKYGSLLQARIYMGFLRFSAGAMSLQQRLISLFTGNAKQSTARLQYYKDLQCAFRLAKEIKQEHSDET